MAEEIKENKSNGKFKALIVILIILLVISAGALAARIVYLNFFDNSATTAVIPDNIIGTSSTGGSSDTDDSSGEMSSEAEGNVSSDISSDASSEAPSDPSSTQSSETQEIEAPVISLYQGQETDNEKFDLHNMLPGDSETKYFAVKISHGADTEVFFTAKVTEQSKSLADVLNIKVTHLESNKVLYNGTLSQMNSEGYSELFKTKKPVNTVAYYKIEASLPTSVGNEYQDAYLFVDFRWLVKDASSLTPPATGIEGSVLPWLCVFAASLLLIIFLFALRRKEKEGAYEN